MLKKERTREELEILLRDQHNVIEQMAVQAGMKDAALATETAAVVVLRNQRNRAIETLNMVLANVRHHGRWKHSVMLDASVVNEARALRDRLAVSE